MEIFIKKSHILIFLSVLSPLSIAASPSLQNQDSLNLPPRIAISMTSTGSTITVNSNDANLTGGIFNQANNISNVSSNINIDQTTISVTSINNGGGQAAGIFAGGNGTVSINHSTINGTADSGTLIGILVSDPASTVNFQNTVISLNTSNTAVGFSTQNAGTLNDNGGNRCFANGVAIPC